MTANSTILFISLALAMVLVCDARRHKAKNHRALKEGEDLPIVDPPVDEKIGLQLTTNCDLKKGGPEGAQLLAVNDDKTEGNFQYFDPVTNSQNVELCKFNNECEGKGKKGLVFTIKSSLVKEITESMKNQKLFIIGESLALAQPQQQFNQLEQPLGDEIDVFAEEDGDDFGLEDLQKKKTSLNRKGKKRVPAAKKPAKKAFRRFARRNYRKKQDDGIPEATVQVYDCCKVGKAHAAAEPESIEERIKKEAAQKQVVKNDAPAVESAGGEAPAGGDAGGDAAAAQKRRRVHKKKTHKRSHKK